MDSANLILTEPVLPPTSLLQVRGEKITKHELSDIDPPIADSQERKKQIAKDFESVLLHKLLEEMKNTIGDWGFDKDGVSTQVQGIFWLHLAREIANQGGFGLWKGIYKFVTRHSCPEPRASHPKQEM